MGKDETAAATTSFPSILHIIVFGEHFPILPVQLHVGH